MTSPRRVSQKSMSKSGIDTRSGLRKRSNSRPSFIGSRSVMVNDQATTEPAPDGNIVILGPFDEVGDDEEVPRNPHRDDHVELEIEPLGIGGTRCIVGD